MEHFVHVTIKPNGDINVNGACFGDEMFTILGTLLQQTADVFNMRLQDVIKKSVEKIPDIIPDK